MTTAVIDTHIDAHALLSNEDTVLYFKEVGTALPSEVVSPARRNRLREKILAGLLVNTGSITLVEYKDGYRVEGDNMSTVSGVEMYVGTGYCARAKLLDMLRSVNLSHSPDVKIMYVGTPFTATLSNCEVCDALAAVEPEKMEMSISNGELGVVVSVTLLTKSLPKTDYMPGSDNEYSTVLITIPTNN